jgi:hypothetical protein
MKKTFLIAAVLASGMTLASAGISIRIGLPLPPLPPLPVVVVPRTPVCPAPVYVAPAYYGPRCVAPCRPGCGYHNPWHGHRDWNGHGHSYGRNDRGHDRHH